MGGAGTSIRFYPLSYTAPADFTAETVDVVFGDGETSATLTISVVDDDLSEPPEIFVALIEGNDATGNCSLAVTIADNDGESTNCCT